MTQCLAVTHRLTSVHCLYHYNLNQLATLVKQKSLSHSSWTVLHFQPNRVIGKRVASVSLYQNCCTMLARSIGVNIKRHRGIPPTTHYGARNQSCLQSCPRRKTPDMGMQAGRRLLRIWIPGLRGYLRPDISKSATYLAVNTQKP